MKYPPYSAVIELHKQLIDKYGGKGSSLVSRPLLESALARPQFPYYDDIYERAAALMESLAKNHPFIDGNKRISYATTSLLLELNGYEFTCNSLQAYNVMVDLFESNSFNYSSLLKWLSKVVKPVR